MEKRLLLIFVICLYPVDELYGQWTREDSVWLNNVLSGKEELHLNPETMKAIRSGTFLNLGKPLPRLPRSVPSELPVTRDFDAFLPAPTDTVGGLNPDIMDPYLYFKYYFMFAKLPPLKEEKVIPGFDLRGVKLRRGPLESTWANEGVTVKRLPFDATPNGPSVSVGGDFNHVLSTMFSPSYRRRMYNREHANAWKTYNSGYKNAGSLEAPRDTLPLPLPTP